MRVLVSAIALFATVVSLRSAELGKGWSFADGPGYRDVLHDGKVVLRHMNAWDPARRDATYKPYTHVFDFGGIAPITKGVGGDFTHHRGMFIGWNKTQFDGKSYDFWHCRNVIRQHREYLRGEEKADAREATMVSVVDWPAPDGKVVIRETQTITATKPKDGKLQLDLAFKLEAPSGPVKLDGDVQHAGFHFRAAQEVHDRQKETSYLMQKGAVKVKGDAFEQCNWVVCQFNIGEARYAVAHFNDPKNASPVQYSTRAYGRFGAFSKSAVAPEQPLNLRYRLIVTDVTKKPVEKEADWQKQFDAFAQENH